jgi:hypothetical protein
VDEQVGNKTNSPAIVGGIMVVVFLALVVVGSGIWGKRRQALPKGKYGSSISSVEKHKGLRLGNVIMG